MTVYALTITDTELSYDNYSADFGIGIFSSYEKAEKTAQKYLQTVAGFCEYPCTYRIEEKNVIDTDRTLPTAVWMITGYNINENMDEIDIIESDCYASEQEAKQQFQNMQKTYHQTEWCLNRWKIDQCHWKDGFCRA